VPLTAATRRAHQGRRRAPWRLDPSGRHPRRGQRPELEGAELCLALLDEAIARAERWLACRERSLADFDVRAVDIVRRLHVAGMIAPSMSWNKL
jgi:hypothetical protein